MKEKAIRRSGARIMASLIMLLGSLAYIMILAVINGSLGFVCAMGVTLFGAVGVAKALGEAVALSYGWIAALAIGCGVLRGLLRYLEQYGNHYIAFRLLAVLRDKIFGALRTLCPAKLESKKKGSIIAMITSDIETLEVFYAHTISPICIAVIVSLAVFIFVGNVSHWYIALTALLGYVLVGIVLPLVSSARLKESGVKYRAEFAGFNAFFLDSIRGIKEIVLNNAGDSRRAEVDRRSDILLTETKKMKNDTARASAATELTVSLIILSALAVGIILVSLDIITIGRMIMRCSAHSARSLPCPRCPGTSRRPLQAATASLTCSRKSQRWSPWKTAADSHLKSLTFRSCRSHMREIPRCFLMYACTPERAK